MNLNHLVNHLPKFETSYSERQEALLLAVVLIVGLTFATPALSLMLGVPVLIFVALTGLIYGILVLVLRRVLVGSLVGFIVTSTFAANVPLASQTYVANVVGHLGPELWLAQVPLMVAIFCIVADGPRQVLVGTARTESLFAAFIGWTVLSALFGATARIDVALYFSLFMVNGLAAFVLLRYSIQMSILSFRSVIEVFILAVGAHSMVALVQLVHGGNFGLSRLGGGPPATISIISLGPFGDFTIGTYVAGFTGMAFILASLIILAVPLTLVLAIRARGWPRLALIGAALLMTAVLRVTGTDAGRGGFILAGLMLCGAYLYLNWASVRDTLSNKQTTRASAAADRLVSNGLLTLATVLATVIILLYPSTGSGDRSVITEIDKGSGGSNGSNGGGASSTNPQSESIESFLHELSIPFFDLTSLGIRFQQYVGGVDLFIQYPLFGIGGANFIYYSTEYGLSQPFPIHNMYLSLLTGAGLPGFLLYIAVLGSVLWYGWRAVKDHAGNELMFVGLLCGVIGYLAFGFWDILQLIKVSSFLPFWILVGAMVGESKRQSITTNG